MSHPPTEDCTFPEVIITEDDEDGNLKAGMEVLLPCSCGETPYDHMGVLELEHKRAGEALLQAGPVQVLFHWAPATRRKQIIRYGLRPHMRVTTSSRDDGLGGNDWRASCVCFADSPSWAWALSGEQPNAPSGEWDLWQTWLGALEDPTVMASEDRLSGIHEVRITHRLFKRDLWWVGSRIKP